jgi:hypothetical protein
MISARLERAARLAAAVGGQRSDETAEIAPQLASAPAAAVADALLEALEQSPEPGPWEDRHWTIGTAAGALFGAAGSYLGLSALNETLALEWGPVPFLPLLVVPLILIAFVSHARGRAKKASEMNESAAVLMALRLIAAGVPEPAARRAAAYVTGTHSESYAIDGASAESNTAKLRVGAAAILVVLIFWVGYYAALGQNTVWRGW